jgi:alkyldihydroxyacetonephosphate synthase
MTHDLPPLGPGAPTPPIALAGAPDDVSARGAAPHVDVPDDVVDRLRAACAVLTTDAAERAEASRDWWPLAMTWALDGQVGGLAAVVARPTTEGEVAAVLRICD